MNRSQAHARCKATASELREAEEGGPRPGRNDEADHNETIADLSHRQEVAPTEGARWIVDTLEEEGAQSEKKGKIHDYVLFFVSLILGAAVAVLLHYQRKAGGIPLARWQSLEWAGGQDARKSGG